MNYTAYATEEDKILQEAEKLQQARNKVLTQRDFLYPGIDHGQTLENFKAIFPNQRTLELMRGKR